MEKPNVFLMSFWASIIVAPRAAVRVPMTKATCRPIEASSTTMPIISTTNARTAAACRHSQRRPNGGAASQKARAHNTSVVAVSVCPWCGKRLEEKQIRVDFATPERLRTWDDFEVNLPFYGPHNYYPWVPLVDAQYRKAGMTFATMSNPS